MNITEYGFWEGEDVIINHYFDKEVSKTLKYFCNNYSIDSIIDLGCGKGDYVKELRKRGYNAIGFDGNPNTKEITDGLCGVLTLHEPFNENLLQAKLDLVLSFEVGEHIPEKYEDVFITNLTSLASRYIILSWAIPNQGGHGHVNCRTNDYVKNKIKEKGFVFNEMWSKIFRNSVEYFWFKDTIMVFEKIQ